MQHEYRIEAQKLVASKRAIHGQACKVVSEELFSSNASRPGIITRVVRATADRAMPAWAEPICAKLRKRVREAHNYRGKGGQTKGWSEQSWFCAGGERCTEAKATVDVYVSALATELSTFFGTGCGGITMGLH